MKLLYVADDRINLMELKKLYPPAFMPKQFDLSLSQDRKALYNWIKKDFPES